MAKIAALTCMVIGMIMMLIVDDALNESDLFMAVTAMDDQWNRVRKTTIIIEGIHNPTWNNWTSDKAWEREGVTQINSYLFVSMVVMLTQVTHYLMRLCSFSS